MRKRLKDKLSSTTEDNSIAGFSNSFDIVGDIAITKLPNSSPENASAVAEAIMNCNSGIKTVLAQTSKIEGEFRLRGLTCIRGEQKTRTIHKEHGCIFAVDVEACYFSPRLSGERLRISKLVQPDETVVNLFAGVGCFSILIAKRVPTAKVYSVDMNPDAYEFMLENTRLNRTFGHVFPMLGDAKTIVETQLHGVADRILMPLPEKALEYLPFALKALKPSGGWLHVHVFEHAAKKESATEKAKTRISDALDSLGVKHDFGTVREIRSIGPNWSQIAADVHITPCS